MYTLIIFVLERHYHTLHNRQCFCNLNLSLRKKRHQNLKNFWRIKEESLWIELKQTHWVILWYIYLSAIISISFKNSEFHEKQEENFNKKIIMSYYQKQLNELLFCSYSLSDAVLLSFKTTMTKSKNDLQESFPSFFERLYPFLLLLSISKSLFFWQNCFMIKTQRHSKNQYNFEIMTISVWFVLFCLWFMFLINFWE